MPYFVKRFKNLRPSRFSISLTEISPDFREDSNAFQNLGEEYSRLSSNSSKASTNRWTAFWGVTLLGWGAMYNWSNAKKINLGTLLFLTFLIGNAVQAFAQTDTQSETYQIKNIFFGDQIAVVSGEKSKPEITGEGPSVTSVQSDTATIVWKTDKASNSIVSYGKKSGSYDNDFGKTSELVKSHTVTLTGLDPESIYYYIVKSADASGNVGSSAEKSFTTTKRSAIAEVTFSDITLTSAILSFKTATIVNATIKYGTDSANLDQSVAEESGSFTTQHAIRLKDLRQGTTFYLQIIANDQYGKTIASDLYVFSTLPEPGLVKLTVENITGNSAEIVVELTTETDLLIKYVTDSDIAANLKGIEQTQGETTRAKVHRLTLSGLIGNSVYEYKIFAQDAYSNRYESGLQTFSTASDITAPIISNLKTESILSRRADKDEAQIIITWDTDEPANSKVRYGRGSKTSAQDISGQQETKLVTNHLIVIGGLSPATTYHFQGFSTDANGNQGSSPPVTLLTARKKRSLLQVVVEQLESIFGWVRVTGIF